MESNFWKQTAKSHYEEVKAYREVVGDLKDTITRTRIGIVIGSLIVITAFLILK